jgi:uncharacterized protein YpmB
MSFKIQVVFKNGDVDYVCTGTNKAQLAVYRTRQKAQEAADFLRQGISDEVQSINVLRCPPYQADRGGNDA